MLKRAMAVILMLSVCAASLCFAVSVDGNLSYAENAAADSFNENEFTKCAENSLYELYVIGNGERTGEFYVRDIKTGTCFYSNPQNRDFSSDGHSSAEEESSQILVKLYSEKSGAVRTINSFRGTANGKEISVSVKDGGFDADYRINNAIKMTLKLRLSDNGFSVETDVSKINNMKGNIVTNVEVLPYFFASAYGETGYSLVPDGSGALIYNNTSNENAISYEGKIYGEDLAFAGSVKATQTRQVYLPVFGARGSIGGFIAAIDDGAENATIKAVTASGEYTYNQVYSSFDTVGSDKLSIGEGVGEISSSSVTYDSDSPLTKKIRISYMLTDNNSGYSEMAQLYREHISLKSGEVALTPSVFLELYGGLMIKEGVYGIPLKVFKKLTTVEQAQNIVSYFKEQTSGQPVVIYRNSDTAVISGKIQNKFRFKGSLGSKNQLNSLKESLDGNLFLENNIFSAQKSGNGFYTLNGVATRINRNNVMSAIFNPATTKEDNYKKPSFAVKSTKLQKIYSKYFSSVEKAGFETAFVNLANTIYSDFDTSGYVSRADTVNTFNGFVKKYGENGVIYSPNAYALASGKYITDVPNSSSGYDVISEDVPFYQLVLSGVKEFSVESVNLESNTDTAFLKALESGASLKFTFVYDNITSVKNTSYDYLFGCDFENRKAQMAEYQKELEEAYKDLGSRVIKKHTIYENGVCVSEFENGNKAVINYSDSDKTTEYGTVKAGEYLIIKAVG